jgi:nitroimidazol reductase NimA-like FMN-containing flavoprotein (pyridoxamine 5'-phosphate oxidase superfamily)
MVVLSLQEAPREYEIKKFELPDMSHSEMDDLIKSQLICRITLHDEPYPYTIPMEYYYFGDVMYFHLTTSGKKIDLISKNPNVTVEIDSSSSDLTKYRSVILKGKLVPVDRASERDTVNSAMSTAVRDKAGIKAFLTIPWTKKGIDYLSASNIPLTLMKLDVEEMTGKKSH